MAEHAPSREVFRPAFALCRLTYSGLGHDRFLDPARERGRTASAANQPGFNAKVETPLVWNPLQAVLPKAL
jgi:hypothetical protein